MRTFLLGPQRFLTTAGTVVRSVAAEGPVATVTAGWQDRESADDELHEVMEGRSRNLQLYRRLTEVIETDDHFAAQALAHRDAMDELAGIYSVRLQRALESVYVVARRPARQDIADSAFDDAVRGVRDIDAWYLARRRPAVRRARGRLAARRQRADLAQPRARSPTCSATPRCWPSRAGTSASCCAACGSSRRGAAGQPARRGLVRRRDGDDRARGALQRQRPAGRAGRRGLGPWCRPGATTSSRCRTPGAGCTLDDPVHARAFVRRFAPAVCLLLDEGTQVEDR